jgi:hypothetical protein
MVSSESKAAGGANRRSPVGGEAYGIPKYSDTPGLRGAAWPLINPLLVRTEAPTCSSG